MNARTFRIGLIVLAAGEARRFGSDKLLALLGGKPLAQWAANSGSAYPFYQKVAVVGDPAGQAASIFRAQGFAIVGNETPQAGMGRSINMGIAALASVDAACILLGDMPWIPSGIFSILSQNMIEGDLDAVRPCHNGKPGHPVLIAARCFDPLKSETGPSGAAWLFDAAGFRSKCIESDDPGVVQDVDQPLDLRRPG